MPFSNWRSYAPAGGAVALLLVIIALGSWASGFDSGPSKRDGDKTTKQQSAPLKLATRKHGIEAAIRDLKAEQDKQEAKRKEDREVSDLDAQWAMARWARAMFWASFASVIVTFGGLLLIWRTLHHTKRAADYAGDMVVEANQTTLAARESLSVTQRTAAAELRAYVFPRVKGVHVSKNVVVSVTLTLKNYGSTPASKVGIKGTVHPFEYPPPAGFSLPMPDAVDEAALSLPPHADTFAEFVLNRSITPGEEEQFRADRLRLCAFALVVYTDAFGNERRTNFCMTMHGPTLMEMVRLSRGGVEGTVNHDIAWRFSPHYNDWT